MFLDILKLFITSICVSLALILIIKSLFYKIKVLDNPKKYGKKRAPIPYSMWIVFFLSFFILSYFSLEHNYKLYLIWFFWFVITVISFVDDMLNVSPKIRLLVQVIIWAIIWMTAIKVGYISNIFWWILDLNQYFFEFMNYKVYTISLIFTIIWYVFIFNSINWTDGIQWNTSGLSIISFSILFLLWLILFFKDDYEWWIINALFIMKMCLILVWILIPFWYFDVKEKILMWDSWTMFLGFMLATIAIISGWKIATVLVVFGIYVVDSIYVIMRRLANKKNPLKWDFTHLHHRLLEVGISKKQVLILLYFMSFSFWITALFLDKIGKIIVFIIITFTVIFINTILNKVKKNRSKKAFTFIELLVSISIIAIIMTSSIIYFSNTTTKIYLNNNINEIKIWLDTLDKQVDKNFISDYEVTFSKGELGFQYLTNKSYSNYNMSIAFDFNNWNWTWTTNQTVPWTYWNYKIFQDNKFMRNWVIDATESFTGTFNNSGFYTFNWTMSGQVLNNVYLKYFAIDNISDNLSKHIVLSWIYSDINKTTSYNYLIIKNIAWNKSILWNWVTSIREVYIFFEVSWVESFIKIK